MIKMYKTISGTHCSTWNSADLVGLYSQSLKQPVELIEGAVMNDQPPLSLLCARAQSHAQTKLRRQVVLQVPDVRRGWCDGLYCRRWCLGQDSFQVAH